MPRREISEKQIIRGINKSEILLHGMKLDDLRKQIDEIDWQLLAHIKKRLSIVKKIAMVKKENGLPIEDKKREAEMLDKLIKDGEKLQLTSNFILRLFKVIINESKKNQKSNI